MLIHLPWFVLVFMIINTSMKLEQIFEARRVYKGKPLETGGTSIQGKAAPALRDLYKKGVFKEGDVILDYGAGKYGRNANFLREEGFKVYAYDPFNGKAVDGYEGVSNKLPKGTKFDVAFTSFVLNVVPDKIENTIIKEIKRFSKKQFHITRNMDIFDSVKKALGRKDKLVSNFFLDEFANSQEEGAYNTDKLTDKMILAFCEFGVQTSKGFQRIPFLDDKGFKQIRKTASYKVFEK